MSRMQMMFTVVGVGLVVMWFSSYAGGSEGSLLERLQSEDANVRDAALRTITRERRAKIEALEKMVREYTSRPDLKGTAKSVILALGKLEAQASIALLLEHLTFAVFYMDVKKPPSVGDRFPCVQALTDIGVASVEPVLEHVVRSDSDVPTVVLCGAGVLHGVLGKDRAIVLLESKLKGDLEEEARNRLKLLLDGLKKYPR